MANKLQSFWMFVQSDAIASNAKTFASTSSQIIGLHTNEVIEVVIPAKKRVKSKEFMIETLQCKKFEVTLIVLTHWLFQTTKHLDNKATNKYKNMSVNKVILIGNVGKDPEIRYLEGNMRVAYFTLATTERGYTLSNGTQVPDRTEWHNIVLWGKLAEYTERYVRKGMLLYIEGRIRSRTYDDKSGIRRYIYEIVSDSMKILSNKEKTETVPRQ